MSKRSCKILIAATGSVAALNIPVLLKSLMDLSVDKNIYCFEIRLTVTRHAKHFFKISDLPKQVKVYDDDSKWFSWQRKGDPVWHVELAKLTDILVIAPLTANTLSKIANGMCDNVLTTTIRSWDLQKPVIFCPAMNVRMWEHPITAKHIKTLKEWGFIEVPPISKILICNTVGVGAMAEVETIVEIIKKVADSRLSHNS